MSDIEIQPFGGVHIPVGELAVPQRFTATVIEEGREIQLAIELDDAAQPRCRAAIVIGEDVTGETLRIPVRRLLDRAVRAAAFRIEPPKPAPPGRPSRQFPWTDYLMDLPVPRERFEDVPHRAPLTPEQRETFAGPRRPRRGSPLTDQQLQQTAELYRRAVERGLPPTKTIAEEAHVTRSTAAKWVQAARRRGFLGAAIRGRGGEREEQT